MRLEDAAASPFWPCSNRIICSVFCINYFTLKVLIRLWQKAPRGLLAPWLSSILALHQRQLHFTSLYSGTQLDVYDQTPFSNCSSSILKGKWVCLLLCFSTAKVGNMISVVFTSVVCSPWAQAALWCASESASADFLREMVVQKKMLDDSALMDLPFARTKGGMGWLSCCLTWRLN